MENRYAEVTTVTVLTEEGKKLADEIVSLWRRYLYDPISVGHMFMALFMGLAVLDLKLDILGHDRFDRLSTGAQVASGIGIVVSVMIYMLLGYTVFGRLLSRPFRRKRVAEVARLLADHPGLYEALQTSGHRAAQHVRELLPEIENARRGEE